MTHLGAIEGGGTWFRLAVGTEAGVLLHTQTIPTTTPTETLAAAAAFFDAHPVAAVGVGCFGPLSLHPDSADFGTVRVTPKPGWSGFPLLAALQERLAVPIALQTDVIASAIGEHHSGAGVGVSSLLYLTIGTGIGGGFLTDGRPHTGILHAEMGHIAIPRQPDDDFAGVCPFHGDCLEGMVSGPALQARWGVPGSELAAEHPAWDLAGRILADGLTTLLAVCAPDRLILGGGVGRSPHLRAPLLSHLSAAVAAYWPAIDATSWLVPPGLGPHAALVGGLMMASRQLADVR